MQKVTGRINKENNKVMQLRRLVSGKIPCLFSRDVFPLQVNLCVLLKWVSLESATVIYTCQPATERPCQTIGGGGGGGAMPKVFLLKIQLRVDK